MNTSSLAGHVVELLGKVMTLNLPADRIVSEFCRERRYIGSHDRRWLTEKIYGIIRNLILLRELLKRCPINPEPLGIFVMHEILMTEMKPDEIEAAYSRLLEAYRLSGINLDLDDLARCAHETFAELKSNSQNVCILNSFPDFFCELLPSNIRKDVVSIMEALNREARVCIRVDTKKVSREEVVESFSRQGVDASVSEFSPLGVYLPKRVNLNTVGLYDGGAIEIQEEASQLVGLIVNPLDGELIVDACAGGGGKTLELAALSGDKSRIYACDIEPRRLKSLAARAARGGFKNVVVRRTTRGSLRELEELVDTADKVIVDAPCTGSGTIRRNPDKKYRLTKSSVEKHAAYQRELLGHYSKLVKPGGLLYYVTCSIFAEENQSVADWFLNADPEYKKVELSAILVEPKYSGMIENGYLAIYPHRYDMDGFFAAVMERVS